MTFEENLLKLESLTNDIKRTDISLEDALKDFEEGIKLAKKLEESLDKIEGQILILTNQPLKAEESPSKKEVAPQMELFSSTDAQSGSQGAPTQGLRQ